MFITKAFAAGSTDHSAEAGSGVFPPFDSSMFASQVFWLAISFGFFLWFMSKVIVPRIGGILEMRQDRIAHDLDKARELSAEAAASTAAYEQEIVDAKARAQQISQKARDKANGEAAAARKTVEVALATKLSDAEARISSIRVKAMTEVGGIAEDTATEIFAKLLGGKITQAEVADAVSAAVSKGR